MQNVFLTIFIMSTLFLGTAAVMQASKTMVINTGGILYADPIDSASQVASNQ